MRFAVSDDDLAPVLLALYEDDSPEAIFVERAELGWVVGVPSPVPPATRNRIVTLGATQLREHLKWNN